MKKFLPFLFASLLVLVSLGCSKPEEAHGPNDGHDHKPGEAAHGPNDGHDHSEDKK